MHQLTTRDNEFIFQFLQKFSFTSSLSFCCKFYFLFFLCLYFLSHQLLKVVKYVLPMIIKRIIIDLKIVYFMTSLWFVIIIVNIWFKCWLIFLLNLIHYWTAESHKISLKLCWPLSQIPLMLKAIGKNNNKARKDFKIFTLLFSLFIGFSHALSLDLNSTEKHCTKVYKLNFILLRQTSILRKSSCNSFGIMYLYTYLTNRFFATAY